MFTMTHIFNLFVSVCRRRNSDILPSLEDLLFYTVAEGEEKIPVHKFLTVSLKKLTSAWCHETGSWSVSCSKYSLFYFRHLKPLDLALEIPGWGSVWKPSKSLWRTRKTASRWTVTFSRSRTHRVSCFILLLPFSWVSAVQCTLKVLFSSFDAFIFAFSARIFWTCQMTTQKEIWVASY